MDKVSDVVSVWDNGEVWSFGWPILYEKSLENSNFLGFKWIYKGEEKESYLAKTGFRIFGILPDHTGFLAMKNYHQPEAYILNGDATVRHVLKPAFNMRGFDAQRLASIRESDQQNAERLAKEARPREEQVLFHYKTERSDALEIFGDDGFGDCYYTYDSTTGELLSARTLPRRS